MTPSIRPFTVNRDVKVPAATAAVSALPSPPLPPSVPGSVMQGRVEEEPEPAAPNPAPALPTSMATQTSLQTPEVTSTPPPPSLLDTYKVHQLDPIFTAYKFFKYLLSTTFTCAYISADDAFLSALRGVTGAEDCSADLVVGSYDGMNEVRRVMMTEVIRVVEQGRGRDENEGLDKRIKIEVPSISDEYM